MSNDEQEKPRVFKVGDVVIRDDRDGSIYIGLHGMDEQDDDIAPDSLFIGEEDVDAICEALKACKATS